MKVEIYVEGVADIVRSDLSEVLENLQDDLERRKEGHGLFIFHLNAKKDIAELKRHIEAFKLVLKYYGA